jgi:HEAT repeats
VATLQSDPDVDHRKVAAVELKNYDPRTHSELLTSLVGTLQKDPSPDVRALAAETIGSYRAVSQSVAVVLEGVELNDPDKTVRAAAKSALWQYGLNGYKPSVPLSPSQTAEPPLAKAVPVAKPTTSQARTTVPPTSTGAQFRPITQGPGKATTVTQSDEPPLARSRVEANTPPAVAPPPGVPQRMPTKLDVPAVAPPKPNIPAVPLPEAKTVVPPQSVPANVVVTPIDPKPTLPLPLPSIPGVPQVMPSSAPTVQPPGK